MKALPTTPLVAFVLAACASEQPVQVESFDSSAGRVVVTILGDGFVRLDGVRMPFDAAVLRLRLRVRPMTREQLAQFVVALEIGKDVPESAFQQAIEDRGRMVHQLDLMEVLQAEIR